VDFFLTFLVFRAQQEALVLLVEQVQLEVGLHLYEQFDGDGELIGLTGTSSRQVKLDVLIREQGWEFNLVEASEAVVRTIDSRAKDLCEPNDFYVNLTIDIEVIKLFDLGRVLHPDLAVLLITRFKRVKKGFPQVAFAHAGKLRRVSSGCTFDQLGIGVLDAIFNHPLVIELNLSSVVLE